MRLEARSPSCFSDHDLLKLDGLPIGEFRGRWFSECVDVTLRGRHRLRLEKESWLGGRFALIDEGEGRVVGEAERCGAFRIAWDLRLTGEPARLVSAGIFNTGFTVLRGGRSVAETNRTGICDGGWSVEDDGPLDDVDLILIGLVYRTILKRRATTVAAASS